MSEKLNNPPLQEVIFEVKFKNADIVDYDLLSGQIFAMNRQNYPVSQSLKPAGVASLLLPFTIQHRFRKAANDYPLYQIGPGIMSYNTNGTKYNEPDEDCWEVYQESMVEIFNSYAKLIGEDKFTEDYIESVTLRFINIVTDVNMHTDLAQYFSEFLGVKIDLGFSSDLTLGKLGHNQLQQLYELPTDESSLLQVNLVTIMESNDRKLIIDIAVKKTGFPISGIKDWTTSAHTAIEDYFIAVTKRIKHLFN